MAKRRNPKGSSGNKNWDMIELGGGGFYRMEHVAGKSPKRFLVIDNKALTREAMRRRGKLKNVDFLKGNAMDVMKKLQHNCTPIILAEHFMTVLDSATRASVIARARDAIKPGGKLICEHYGFLIPGVKRELQKAGFQVTVLPVKSAKKYHEESVTAGIINAINMIEKHGAPDRLQDNLNSLKAPFCQAAKTIKDPKLKELLLQKLDAANTLEKFRESMWPHKIIAINKKP